MVYTIMHNRPELKKFDRDDFYKTGTDLSYKKEEKGFHVELYPEGREVISQYYSNKYHTNIKFLQYSDDIEDDQDIVQARDKKLENYRKAFIIGDQTHSELIVYLKEKDKECILYADSINICKNKYALKMYDLMKIPLYIVDDIRQRDMYSCHTDALVMSRDITAKDDAKSTDYFFKNLFSQIEERSKNKSKLIADKADYKDAPIYDAILPDFLLKTAQRSKFFSKHKEKTNPIIHKNETYRQFLKRYQERLKIMNEEKDSFGFHSQTISRYLILKGRKFADIIEIQFYLNQLQEFFKDNWTKKMSLEFITNAKATLRSQGPINEREGLHSFVEKYVATLQENLNPSETSSFQLKG